MGDEKFVEDFIFYYGMWQTLKPGFDCILDWWENIKVRIKELSVKHGVRLARERRSRLHDLQTSCNLADRDTLCSLLRQEQMGAFIRSREKFLEGAERPGG